VRAIWKGAVSFGLVNVPVRLYSATQEHDIRFHQVHRDDGGRIRMKRTCEVCGETISYDQIAKGYDPGDGRLVILTDEDLESLPLSSGHEIDVLEFVPTDQVDPIMFGRTYYLEPDARAVKPYALLREALTTTERMAVVKVALRQRESLAVLRVRDQVIVLQTLLWPDEVRAAEFDVLETEVDLRPQELTMAASLVESLASDFDPDQFEDQYATAMTALVESKLEGAEPAPATEAAPSTDEVVDLLTALQRSVERAREARGEEPAAVAAAPEPAKKAPARTAAKKAAPAAKTAAKAPAKKAAPAKKTAAKAPTKTAAKAASKTAAKSTAKKAPARKSA
jgi:DNA end-binding protein Ku